VLCNELVRRRLISKPLREPSVAFQVLPHVRIAHPDELLSSWIERIGLFYGIGYLGARIILEPTRANNEHGQVDDIDSSASIRHLRVTINLSHSLRKTMGSLIRSPRCRQLE
jgi:hypothetical protein